MSHINIPHPSPHSSLPSESPIHLSSPSSDGWMHIISVAQSFSDRLSQLPQDTPVATNDRWSQRCRDKGITGTKTEDIQYFSTVPPVASASLDDSDNGTQPKRRRGRPPGRTKKSIAPAIVAAKRNLRQISEISDRQWGHKEPEVANESSAGTTSQDEDNNSQNLRRSTRSVRRRTDVVESSSDNNIIDHPNTSEPAAEPEQDVEPNVETDIEVLSEPRKFKKQPTTRYIKPSTLFFFTTLPKPIPSHLQNRAHTLSFSSIQPLGHRRTLTSDNVVMLCMRAKVRKQKRMREAGVSRITTQIPQGGWLKRNLRIMERRMERIHSKKGKQVDREVGPVAGVEEPQEQPSNDNEIDTSREQIDVEEARTSVRRRGRKRKRKSN
ncbi:uncharacterized protein DFL_007700 [Arthrobotrys flagrans]|uniref:Uncharacterized protein n=1 Tax=Arthrobotrys flagrans TaxID=97331 RepID=A0A436ZX34_ARTFL|nr:hypothetical protein DFL_007700 [Arthrobotrys flagrans]